MGLSTTFAITVKSTAVSTAAKAITDFSFSAADINVAERAKIGVIANTVMLTYDGTTPTATLGLPIPANTIVEVLGNHNINNIKIIRLSADATVTIQLEA